ncbi:hypothetical protein AGDE_12735 [Angomonas deanei]|uniref:REH2 DRSM domain-containing protein n=1 Tax=Angomonas deanei TaxID=59799 RepID=A0A7G2CA46_9TRYP|nr:hypothetical protein AGDE_12735 [Angomonas deanei]CAD2214882.1 hypothetical protein, conserved [Angomonas deanei]|eukprot:EPY23612.1 hypothetical protein AGDE_12735 [Angomonas deanei]
MHAEYMIDFLGFHIYTLENMQRKHALSARKQGRHAPSPDDQQVARHSFQHFPLPLRRAAKDETEGGRWQLLGEPQEYNFVSPPHALLSPCVVDPAAVTRIRNVLYTVDFNLHHLCVTKRLKGRSNNIPVYYESEILLPQALIGKHNLKARGKATNKQLSLELACMHAELILDALGVCIFPNDNEAQRDHAMSCWQYGRPAPLPGTAPKLPSEVNLPAPLKVVSSVGRAAPLSEEERLTRDHVTLGRQCDEMTDTTVLESNAIGTLGRFLKERSFTRVGNPFFQELLPNGKTKSTIVLPLPSSYGIRGGVGIATVPANANVLAAMHALDVLSVLGIPVSENDPLNESVRWAVLRHEHFGSPLFEKSPDPQAVSPPGRRERCQWI